MNDVEAAANEVKRVPAAIGTTQAVYACEDWSLIQQAGRKVYHGSKEVCGIRYIGYGKYAVFYKLGLGKELDGNVFLEVK